MSIGYARAYVDRAATTSEGPIRFVAATEGRKGDGIDLRMAGARLDRFRSNPVFLYGHRYWGRDSLPIGRGEQVEVDSTPRLLIDVTFDRDDEFATTVERKYREGYMNAVSIGFEVQKWEGGKGDYWSGGVAEEWELLELSAVPVPMDAAAVVDSGRGRALTVTDMLGMLDLIDSIGAVDVPIERDANLAASLVRISDELVDQADPRLLGLAIARGLVRARAVPPTPKDVPPAPADEGINPDAARDLLAAITLLEGDPQ